jgi:hypothetical protein
MPGSGVLNAAAIQKVVRELLKVLEKQKDAYIDRIKSEYSGSSWELEDDLVDIGRELEEIERSVVKLSYKTSVLAALLVSWFYAVLVMSEELRNELLEELEIEES